MDEMLHTSVSVSYTHLALAAAILCVANVVEYLGGI